MTGRDLNRLIGVHPRLCAVLAEIFVEMAAAEAPMFVVEGVRTAARQQALYAQGRTIVGRVVTYKDGVTHRSNHQPHEDGYGYAVDCAFVDTDPFNARHPWELFGQLAEQRGASWGGRWKMADLPHVEWPDRTGVKVA